MIESHLWGASERETGFLPPCSPGNGLVVGVVGSLASDLTPEVYEGGMKEKRGGARLEIGVPGKFTHRTNVELGQGLAPHYVTQARRAESSSCPLVKVRWESQ
jgi:hypothetical protein